VQKSIMADRESGIREVSDSRPRKYRFPDGRIPDKSKESPVGVGKSR
jgi:hypothetical protein